MSVCINLGTGDNRHGCSIVLDALKPAGERGPAVLLTLEGRIPGNIMNCVIIPLDKIGAVIASLELAESQAARL